MGLSAKLKATIKEQGPISVAQYMSACLFDSEFGYYRNRDFTKDFVTAPELTPLFGEMLGLWVVDCWEKLGKPLSFSLVECGAGNGTLMLDALRAMQQVSPACCKAAKIYLIETSGRLQDKQRQKLQNHIVRWGKSIFDADFSQPTILIANELLDAFPVHQFVRVGEQYFERMVSLDETDDFTFTLGKEPVELENDSGATIVEHSTAESWFSSACAMLSATRGYGLFIDYGYTAGAGDTLQAMQKHKPVDIFTAPGKADLTTHVNFAQLAKLAGDLAHPMCDLSTFLIKLGLPTHARRSLEKLELARDKKQLEDAVQRLIDPNQMGSLQKVLTLSSPGLPAPACCDKHC